MTVTGTATVVEGTTLPATARVAVLEPVEANAAVEDGVTVSATYTENGYSTAGLRNGDRTEKAWSNWRAGAKNPVRHDHRHAARREGPDPRRHLVLPRRHQHQLPGRRLLHRTVG